MTAQIVKLDGIRLTFGGTPLLTAADLLVAPGDRICLVGRNGSGKSTLLKIAAGLVEADAGGRFVHPDARVRYLPQDADFSGFDTALSYVEAGLGPLDDVYAARRLFDDLGVPPDADPELLSGGEARKLALARVLAPEPEVLLLDEPTNHLDLPTIEWLERKLAGQRGAIVLISHDRRMLEALSRTCVWIDRGRTRRLERGFAHFEAWRDKLLEEDELERHKLDRKIERELEWMYGGGVTARRKRNMRRVGELAALREARKSWLKAPGQVRMTASEASQSGKLVMEAIGISKSYDGRAIVRDFSTRIGRGDRVGLIGPNGAGKTTLLNLLTGQIAPDAGEVRQGTGIEMVTLDQRRAELDPETRVADVLTGGRGDYVEVNGHKKHVASYLGDFLFLPEQSRSPVKVLSGGERARLLLAKALARRSNLLVLDEPTNDLDIETLDLLQELLADYQGTLLLVSHDRDFLDRVATSVIASEGDGKWQEYAGGYSDMVAQRGVGIMPDRARAASADRRAGAASGNPPTLENASSAGETSGGKAQRKLSFKESHALKTLPGTIARLETEIAALSASVGDAALYTRDPAAFNSATARLSAAQAELTSAEEQWLELEMKREALEAS
jgi:ATP-binding cassette subfamily F protein uup